MKAKILLSIIFILIISFKIHGQSPKHKELAIGDEMMEIEINNARNLPKHIKKFSDLKGKLVLLDFWGFGCLSCIKAFPKMKDLQKEFNGKLQILVINPDKPDSVVDKYINSLKNVEIKESYRFLSNLNGDRVWLGLFPYRSVPHHVWISPEGKVIAITDGSNANSENVKKVLEGKKLDLLLKEDLVGFDLSKNGILKRGDERLPMPNYYSTFMPYHSGMGSGTYIKEDSITKTFRCLQRNLAIPTLYKLASLQKRVLIETNNVSQTNEYIHKDQWKLKNLMTYELVIPLPQKINYRSLMLEDLNRYLSMKKNIIGAIENRDLPAYIIVQKKNTSRSDNKSLLNNKEKLFQITNVEALQSFIEYQFEDIDKRRIVVEETGLTQDHPLNFSLPETVNDIETLKEYINPFGFDIIEGKRTVELLVIKDK